MSGNTSILVQDVTTTQQTAALGLNGVQYVMPGGVSVSASSGNVAAATATATLAGVAGKTTYVSGFEITGAGATAASVVVATLTGCAGGTLSYVVVVPAGATTSITPLVVNFSSPIAASAVNTAITLSLPSLGAGNTNAAVVIHGYQV